MKQLMLFTIVVGYVLFHYGQSVVPFLALGSAIMGVIMINYEKKKGWVR